MIFPNKKDIIEINSINQIVYNEEEFSKDQNFECKICMGYIINELEPSKMKVLQCVNGHFFCYTCWDKQLNICLKRECPICKVYIASISSLSNNLFLTNLFKNKVKVKCPTNINNVSSSLFNEMCNKIIILEELETHIKTCIHSLVKCEINTLCEEKFKLKDKIDHELNKCIYRTIECPYCQVKTRNLDYKLHKEIHCKEYIVNCRKCNIKIKSIDCDKHFNEECMESKIDCVIKNCFSSFYRKDLISHCQGKGNQEHLEISNQFIKFEKEMNELFVKYISRVKPQFSSSSLGSGGLFGEPHTTSTTQTTSPFFSNSSSISSGGLFGGSVNTSTTPTTGPFGGLFGKSHTTSCTPTTSPFRGTSTSSSISSVRLFGEPLSTSITPTTGPFGSTSTSSSISSGGTVNTLTTKIFQNPVPLPLTSPFVLQLPIKTSSTSLLGSGKDKVKFEDKEDKMDSS